MFFLLFLLHKIHWKRNMPNDHCQIPQLSILCPSYVSLSLLWQHFMWIIKCHRNVTASSVQRYITIIIIPYKFNFFISWCQKLFKKVIIIILPLWQGKKDKGQNVPSSFRRLGSFCHQWRKTANRHLQGNLSPFLEWTRPLCDSLLPMSRLVPCCQKSKIWGMN